MPLLHYDLEVFSEEPFGSSKTSVGVWNYANAPSTWVMLAGFTVDHSPVHVCEGFMPRWVVNGWQEHPEGEPRFEWTMQHELLHRALTDDSYEIVCFNAEFERIITQFVIGIPINPSRFICTMARAWSLSFVGGLDEVAKEMGFPPDKQKLARGRRMMQKFTKPRRPSKTNPATRWLPEDAPDDWQEFKDYCAQDVVVSRGVHAWCERYPWHPVEREMWNLDQEINDRGWPIDVKLVRNANNVRKAEEARLRRELEELTGLDNPNSRNQMMGWLKTQGVELSNLQAETVDAAIDQLSKSPGFDGYTARVLAALELKQQLGAATPKKLDALERNVFESRLRASLEFGAAQRTQRWGGRVVQPHNLFSEREFDPDELADIITYADLATVTALYDDPMRVLKGVIRPTITAPPGRRLVVADYSSIESRLLGWNSGEERINRLFREGGDTYKDLASRVFNKPVEDVTKAERTFCKPPELGAGYMLSGQGLVAYAAGMGVDMDEGTAKRVIGIWRDSNPAVVQMWDWFDAVVKDVVANSTVHEGYGVRIRRDEFFMFIDLPSGRSIYYYQPQLQPNDWGKWSLSYMGRYQDEGGKWQRVFTHPGKTTENIIQAEARDILRDDLLLSSRLIHEMQLIGHVHDEPIGEAKDRYAEAALAKLVSLMAREREHMPGLIMRAEGELLQRYKKL